MLTLLLLIIGILTFFVGLYLSCGETDVVLDVVTLLMGIFLVLNVSVGYYNGYDGMRKEATKKGFMEIKLSSNNEIYYEWLQRDMEVLQTTNNPIEVTKD